MKHRIYSRGKWRNNCELRRHPDFGCMAYWYEEKWRGICWVQQELAEEDSKKQLEQEEDNE